MDYFIRTVEKQDNKDLAKMIRKVFEEYNAPKTGTVYSDRTTDQLYEYFQKPSSSLWVAVAKGKAVGCCGIYPTPGLADGYAELVKFYIAKEYRSIGLGKKLMSKSIEKAVALGYSHIYIESLPEFSKAISIYQKQGFNTLEQPLCDSGHSNCNIWMVKDLRKYK